LSSRLKVCPYYARAIEARKEQPSPESSGRGIQFLPPSALPLPHPPPSPDTESTVSPILMYLLHPSPLAFHSAGPASIYIALRDPAPWNPPREDCPETHWSPCLSTVALPHTVFEMSQVRTGVTGFRKWKSDLIVINRESISVCQAELVTREILRDVFYAFQIHVIIIIIINTASNVILEKSRSC